MALNVVIMAAGKGTRMKSALPKVLHKLAGAPLLAHVMDAAARTGADRTVIITGHGAEAVEAAFADRGAIEVWRGDVNTIDALDGVIERANAAIY